MPTSAQKVAACLERNDVPIEWRALIHQLYLFALRSENGKVFCGFSEQTIKTILADRLRAGRLVTTWKSETEPSGLFAWYRFKGGWTWDDIKAWRDDDDDGEEIFMAYLFGDSPQIVRQLVHKFIDAEPQCLYLRLSGMRQKGSPARPRRVVYSQRLLTKLISNGKVQPPTSPGAS